MLPQIIDPIRIVDAAVLLQFIVSAESVLHHHQRNLIAVVDFVQGIAQSFRVDLPAPVAGLQIRIVDAADQVSAGSSQHFRIHGLTYAHVITERKEIHRAFPQDFIVPRLLFNDDIFFLKEPFRVRRIISSHVDIRYKPVHPPHHLLIFQHIVGIAGIRITCSKQGHISHLELRIFFMGKLHCFWAGHKLMVERLIADLNLVRHCLRRPAVAFYRTEGQNRPHRHCTGVDPIECQPVFYFIPVALKDRFAVTHKAVDHFARIPSVVFFHKPVGDLIVGDRHKQLDIMVVQLVKYFVIKSKSRLVGLRLRARKEKCRKFAGA